MCHPTIRVTWNSTSSTEPMHQASLAFRAAPAARVRCMACSICRRNLLYRRKPPCAAVGCTSTCSGNSCRHLPGPNTQQAPAACTHRPRALPWLKRSCTGRKRSRTAQTPSQRTALGSGWVVHTVAERAAALQGHWQPASASPHLAGRAVLLELRHDERTGHQVISRRQHHKAGRRQLLRPQAHLVPHKLAPKHLHAAQGTRRITQAHPCAASHGQATAQRLLSQLHSSPHDKAHPRSTPETHAARIPLCRSSMHTACPEATRAQTPPQPAHRSDDQVTREGVAQRVDQAV